MLFLISCDLIDPIDQYSNDDKNKEWALKYHYGMIKDQCDDHQHTTDYYYDAFDF